MTRWKKWSLGCATFALILGGYGLSTQICISAWLQGMTTKYCPATQVIPTLSMNLNEIQRGSKSSADFNLSGRFLSKPYEFENLGTINQFSIKLRLEDHNGSVTPIQLEQSDELKGFYTFDTPMVDDGSYIFIAEATSAFGTAETRIPVDLYAKAIGHLLTDRPLYEPGQDIQARILLLNARALNPLQNRFGKWKLIAPNGQTIAEKERQTETWGTSAVRFSLSDYAPNGTWTIAFESGDFYTSQSIRVEPFTLPRFTVETESDSSYYRSGDTPQISGKALFSSGAPVSNAQVTVSWSMDSSVSSWKPPLSWNETDTLSDQLETDPQGRFTLDLPEIPDDLMGQAVVVVTFKVTDATGESIYSSSRIKLSEDPIQAEGITEWNGLAEGINNRLFIRVATPDNQPLPNHQVNIKRSWDQTDGGIDTTTDENGIAMVQMDPGSPINVIIPPMPFREPPPEAPVQLATATHLSNGRDIKMADILKLELLDSSLASCTKFMRRRKSIEVQLFVNANGLVAARQSDSAVGQCILTRLKSLRLTSGTPRIINLEYDLQASPYPQPDLTFWDNKSSPWNSAWTKLQYEASACLKKFSQKTSSMDLIWYAKENQKKPVISISKSVGLTASEKSCVLKLFQSASSTDTEISAQMNGMTLRFSGYVPPNAARRPTAKTFLGYELTVEAEDIGSSKIQMKSAAVPDIRIRTEPNIAKGGETVSFEIIRGPDFSGTLPEYLTITHPDGHTTEHAVDKDSRKTAFKIPDDKTGWYTTQFWETTGYLFVPSTEELAIELKTSSQSYRPGSQINLNIDVSLNGQPTQAAVGLFGVDKSLGDLSPLATPNDFTEALRFYATSESQSDALGLGASALQQGLIQGSNAQQAAMSMISSTPTLAEKEVAQYLSGSSDFIPEQAIVDAFYVVLEALHHQARKWESNAQPHAQFKAETVLSLWEEAIQDCQDQGLSCTDIYGRPLRLSHLPPKLLMMTEPKVLVVDGKRLPEDMVNWSDWIKEQDL